jgi:hypothetical protein
MKTRVTLLIGTLIGVLLVGCNEPSQDLPPGASFKDPTGVNAKNASGQTPAQAEADRKIGENVKNFGAEMNAKYGKQ